MKGQGETYMKLINKFVSITIILAMLFSMCVVATVSAESTFYSVYANEIGGKIELEDAEIKIENGTTFKVYVYADMNSVEKAKVTAFHLLGSVSSNLEIVDSGFAANEAILNLEATDTPAADIPADYQDFETMLHNSKTTGTTIDFTAVVFKNTENNAIDVDEDGFAKLIWIELKAKGNGTYKINLDDSFVKYDFTTEDTKKLCMTGVSFSKSSLPMGDDGTTVPSGTVTGGGGYISGKKDGKIHDVEVDKIDDATVTIDEENKIIKIEVPEGTDLANLSFTFDYDGKEISVKNGEIVDVTEPIEVKVTGTNNKETTYSLEVAHKVAGPDDAEEGIFADVELGRWSYDMIKDMYDEGIIHGYGKDENGKIIIKPDDEISREEAAKISVSAYGLDVSAYAETTFDDNDLIDSWAVPYVAAGAAHPNKMVKGYPDNTFKPFIHITREELVALVISTFGFGIDENPEIKFADADEMTWSAPYISKAVNLGIVVGYEDGTFRPKQYVTREEALTEFDRALIIYKSLTAMAE
ncbi:MAG: S-layer homology domain-containing protein [Ruminococcaceae bacterium]|nr:S-layer homology domain-containing protein [Oscillospiraceae bacterium]